MDNNITNVAGYNGLLTVSPSPHIKHRDTTRSIMISVIIAMLPALVWGAAVFGLRSLTVTLESVFFCVLFEFIYQLLMKKPITVLDFSAVVTGMLIGLNLPASIPLWIPPLASFFAIIVVKQLPAVKIGKSYRVKESDLINYETRNQTIR